MEICLRNLKLLHLYQIEILSNTPKSHKHKYTSLLTLTPPFRLLEIMLPLLPEAIFGFKY